MWFIPILAFWLPWFMDWPSHIAWQGIQRELRLPLILQLVPVVETWLPLTVQLFPIAIAQLLPIRFVDICDPPPVSQFDHLLRFMHWNWKHGSPFGCRIAEVNNVRSFCCSVLASAYDRLTILLTISHLPRPFHLAPLPCLLHRWIRVHLHEAHGVLWLPLHS